MTDDDAVPDAAAGVPALDAVSAASAEVSAFAADAAAQPDLGVDIAATIAWAVTATPRLPLPGAGRTAERWEMLAAAAVRDVAAARVLEPHADAVAIVAEARADGQPVDEALRTVDAGPLSSWGVYAAEGPGVRLSATPAADGTWRLDGTKPWCSLAGHLTHALVTAWTGAETRGLFAVALAGPDVLAHPGPWVPPGLRAVVSAPVEFTAVRAAPIGDAGWYLRRAGFAWGGLGVAAIWWGSALPLAAKLAARAARPDADQIAALLAGRAELANWVMRSSLAEAARLVDAAHLSPARLAATVRAVVHDQARHVRDLALQGLGPGPLTADAAYSRRIADLEVYLGQHHGERDVARLGRSTR